MADGSSSNIPAWIKHPNSNDWNKVLLGQTILPGTARIDGLDISVDVETKKAKGSEKPTSKDNGTKPGVFEVILQLTEKDFDEYVQTLPDWNPRRLGRERKPLVIIHPLVNAHGIREVRVLSVKTKSPSARDGLEVRITLAEWFDKPIAVKKPQDRAGAGKTAEDSEFAGWAEKGPIPREHFFDVPEPPKLRDDDHFSAKEIKDLEKNAEKQDAENRAKKERETRSIFGNTPDASQLAIQNSWFR